MKALFNTPYHVGIRNATDISEEDSRRQWRKYTKTSADCPNREGTIECAEVALLLRIYPEITEAPSLCRHDVNYMRTENTHIHTSTGYILKGNYSVTVSKYGIRDKYTFNKSSNNRIQSTCGVVEGLFSSLRMTLPYECKQTHEIPLHSYEHSTFITKCNYIR
jgi:hypothetical protein